MKLFREPLVHFLAIGAALFGIYAYWGQPDVEEHDKPGWPMLTNLRLDPFERLGFRCWCFPSEAKRKQGNLIFCQM
jgi:hypothetical protein